MLVQQWMWAAVLSPSRPPKAVPISSTWVAASNDRGRADGGGGVRRRFLCTGQDGGVGGGAACGQQACCGRRPAAGLLPPCCACMLDFIFLLC
jgi:hypothetical protein